MKLSSFRTLGFVSYSDVCWFQRNNYFVKTNFDQDTCSPYMTAGNEWISYENEQSIACKAAYIKANGFGGAMIFSLNTDDHEGSCATNSLPFVENRIGGGKHRFPLLQTVHSVLLDASSD